AARNSASSCPGSTARPPSGLPKASGKALRPCASLSAPPTASPRSAPASPPPAPAKPSPPSSAAPTPRFTRPRAPGATRCTWPRSGWWPDSGAQRRADLSADLAEIDSPRIIGRQPGDHLAHVLGLAGAGGRDRRLDRGGHLVLGERLGQEFVENVDLLLFHRRQVGSPGLGIDGETFLALLHHLLDHGEDFVIGRRALALAAIGDVAILDGGIDGPQGGRAPLVAGLQRLLEPFADVFAHGRAGSLLCRLWPSYRRETQPAPLALPAPAF